MKKNSIIAAVAIAGFAASAAAYFIIKNRRRRADEKSRYDEDGYLNVDVIAYRRKPLTYKVSDHPEAPNNLHDYLG